VTVPTLDRAVDQLCSEAVELARAAAVEVGGGDVGEHVGCAPAVGLDVVDRPRAADGGADAEDLGADVMATEGIAVDHSFACAHPGYRGWRWCVTVARAPDDTVVTVDEVVLLPGPDALLAPPWLPWSERLRPGDLGPGDLLPTAPDDTRLVPAYADPDALDRPEAFAPGLGRARVLSAEGRDDAAERWHVGPGGPEAPVSRQAPDVCARCGFYVPLAGPLGQAFGVCANALTDDDGRVVSADHGCGAHSEAVEPLPLAQADAPPPLVDDHRYEYEVVPT
jgi:hypothetical protein